MTRAARPAGQSLTDAAREMGLVAIDRGMGWLTAQLVEPADRGTGSRSLAAIAGDRRPVVAPRSPVLAHAEDLVGVLNRLILSAVVLWLPAVCAWWVSSTLAALPMLVWYVAVAPILMRDIWASQRKGDRLSYAESGSTTTPEG
jgi:hypothetical protein